MIPTVSKFKIPQTHSYAINAKLISEALLSVPQFEALTLHFYGHWALTDKRKIHPLLNVNYSNFRETQYSPKSFAAKGFYNKSWEIVVYSILRQQKAEVKRLLLDEGLPKMKEWLSAKRSSTWLEGRRTLSILFDEGLRSLRYEEDDNR